MKSEVIKKIREIMLSAIDIEVNTEAIGTVKYTLYGTPISIYIVCGGLHIFYWDYPSKLML